VTTCYVDAEVGLVHVFEVDEDAPTPRGTRCDCEQATWGEMDDLLTLTEMWAIGAR
jgi:hypothetical protein